MCHSKVFLSRIFILAINLIPLLLIAQSTARSQPAIDDVRRKLSSDYFEDLYGNTYRSLCERIYPDGFFQESASGGYIGMFPRTIGAMASLFIETGDLDRAQAAIDCVRRATLEHDMERIPHVFEHSVERKPIDNGGAPIQPDHPNFLLNLNGHYKAMQLFDAPAEPVRAVEFFLTSSHCQGTINFAIMDPATGDELSSVSLSTKEPDKLAGNWIRIELPQPLQLQQGRRYGISLQFQPLNGFVMMWGLPNTAGRNVPGIKVSTPETPAWTENPGSSFAYIVDTGKLRREDKVTIGYPLISNHDQIDGQTHVIMAWARLALTRERNAFEDQTYAFWAKLMDRTSDWPYFAPYTAGGSAHVGLVLNRNLEHSREGRLWQTQDVLTQHFVGAALDAMIKVARRRGDETHAAKWNEKLNTLKQGLEKMMLRDFEGKKIYLEMRHPDSSCGVPYDGLSWLNLSPIAAQWEGLDRQVLRDTVGAYRQLALRDWHGYKWLAVQTEPPGTPAGGPNGDVAPAVIGKGVGWELDFSRQEKEYGRIIEWLDFIEQVNTGTPIYLEAANYFKNEDRWLLQDPGNGEQCFWWCWAMARLRKEAGLPALPRGMATPQPLGKY